MQMLEGTKYFYMVLNGLMTQDPDNLLLLQDHAMDSDVKCISNTVTRRCIQLKTGLFRLDVDHFNDLEGRSLVNTVADTDQVEPMVERIMNYLDATTDHV